MPGAHPRDFSSAPPRSIENYRAMSDFYFRLFYSGI